MLTASDLLKGFGERLLIESLSFDLPRAGIVGVIGANGAGKTTLFRMITGEDAPDAGKLELGDTVQLAYVDQSRDALDAQKTVWEEISEGVDAAEGGRPRGQLAPVHRGLQLQGLRPAGADRQRSRAASATACTSPSCCAAAATCCCSTSRPTTSTSTRCARSRTRCSNSPGAPMVISHDRWFLDRVATHVLAFEGDSQVTWFEGNFEAYEEHRRALLGAAADRPHRITYKRLVRG